MRAAIEPLGDGRYRVELSEDLRELVRSGVEQVRELVVIGDPALARLFPPAHPTDEVLEAEWRELMAGQLIEARLAAFDVVDATLDQGEIDGATLEGWMQGINAVRLVIGTIVDIPEDPDEDFFARLVRDQQQFSLFRVYDVLSNLLARLVGAAASDLPPPAR